MSDAYFAVFSVKKTNRYFTEKKARRYQTLLSADKNVIDFTCQLENAIKLCCWLLVQSTKSRFVYFIWKRKLNSEYIKGGIYKWKTPFTYDPGVPENYASQTATPFVKLVGPRFESVLTPLNKKLDLLDFNDTLGQIGGNTIKGNAIIRLQVRKKMLQ